MIVEVVEWYLTVHFEEVSSWANILRGVFEIGPVSNLHDVHAQQHNDESAAVSGKDKPVEQQ